MLDILIDDGGGKIASALMAGEFIVPSSFESMIDPVF